MCRIYRATVSGHFSLGIVSGMYSTSEFFSSVVISEKSFLRASSCEGGFSRVMLSASGSLCIISTEEDTSNASSCSRCSRLSEVRGFKGVLMSLHVSPPLLVISSTTRLSTSNHISVTCSLHVNVSLMVSMM